MGQACLKKSLATPKLGVAGILYLWIIDLKLTTNSKTINPEFFNHSYFLQIYIIHAILVKLVRIGQKIVKFWTRHFGIGCYIETVKKDSILSPIQMPTYIRRMQSNWAVFSWSIFIRAVIGHMTCYNFNWPKIKLWVHYFVFSCALDHILKS